MLGSNLELARGVMCNELTEEGVILIKNKIIKSDSRAHKDLLYALDALYLAKHMRILRMVNLKVLTWGGSKALFTRTNAARSLLVTRGITEVCGRSANVVYITLEVGHRSDNFGLLDNTLLTP